MGIILEQFKIHVGGYYLSFQQRAFEENGKLINLYYEVKTQLSLGLVLAMHISEDFIWEFADMINVPLDLIALEEQISSAIYDRDM